MRGRRGRDRLVVGFTTPYATSVYHHSIRARCTTLCDKVYQWLPTGRWSSQVPPVLHQQNWPPRYKWSIVESGVKHHQTNKFMLYGLPFSSSFLYFRIVMLTFTVSLCTGGTVNSRYVESMWTRKFSST